jgi:hypothetical protein
MKYALASSVVLLLVGVHPRPGAADDTLSRVCTPEFKVEPTQTEAPVQAFHSGIICTCP